MNIFKNTLIARSIKRHKLSVHQQLDYLSTAFQANRNDKPTGQLIT